jgi:serine/threonine protein kinase
VDEVMFGRYRLFEVIGQGGMGTVYRAHDTEIGRDVAIKVLPPELASEPGYQQRFRREAQTAARLAEPHVIPIYDTGEIDGHLYLVTPIIDGVDLESLLSKNGPIFPPRAVEIVEQLATALQTAHNAGLVHRDVKPSNALITANGFVYLIDFGIAHDASATKLTRTGSIVGTWAYMAPERFGSGTADARADVYALACVFYECLTGQLPYPGNGLEQLVAGHLTGPIPRPTTLNPALPAGFDQVIAQGMAKDPQQRYQTAIPTGHRRPPCPHRDTGPRTLAHPNTSALHPDADRRRLAHPTAGPLPTRLDHRRHRRRSRHPHHRNPDRHPRDRTHSTPTHRAATPKKPDPDHTDHSDHTPGPPRPPGFHPAHRRGCQRDHGHLRH